MNKTASSLDYSIIVPVYNGADTLADCLQLLTNQDFPAGRYEVIVIDDGSTDETAQIARQFPVRLIQLESNQGRVVARNTGAYAASFSKLVFVDVRVRVPTNLLSRIAEIDYLPLNPHVFTEGGWFNRVLSLFRARYYIHNPIGQNEAHHKQPILLNETNWRRMPKGTTIFACTREMWLTSQPAQQGKHISDDTRIFELIQDKKPIMRVYSLTVKYLQRETLSSAIRHLLGRGPRFYDYYLRPGGIYRRLGIALLSGSLLMLVGLVVLALIAGPARALLAAVGLIVLLLLGIGLYLARRPSDVPLAMLLVPLIVSAFGIGILWGIIIHTRNTDNA